MRLAVHITRWMTAKTIRDQAEVLRYYAKRRDDPAKTIAIATRSATRPLASRRPNSSTADDRRTRQLLFLKTADKQSGLEKTVCLGEEGFVRQEASGLIARHSPSPGGSAPVKIEFALGVNAIQQNADWLLIA